MGGSVRSAGGGSDAYWNRAQARNAGHRIEVFHARESCDRASGWRGLPFVEAAPESVYHRYRARPQAVVGTQAHSDFAMNRYGQEYYQAQMTGAAGQPVIEVNGQLRFTLPGTPVFPSLTDDSILKPRLEWMLGLAFDATDAPVMTHAALATITPEGWATARFVLHPSAHRADLLADTAPAWRRLQLEETPPTCEDQTGTTPLVIWRKHLEPHFRPLAEDEAWAIDATMRGESFAGVCEGVCEWHEPEDAANRAATLLGNWIGDRLVSSVAI